LCFLCVLHVRLVGESVPEERVVLDDALSMLLARERPVTRQTNDRQRQ
jgi:hypothetical protein